MEPSNDLNYYKKKFYTNVHCSLPINERHVAGKINSFYLFLITDKNSNIGQEHNRYSECAENRESNEANCKLRAIFPTVE